MRFDELLTGEPRVKLGGRDLGVAEELLQMPQRSPAPEHVGGARMAQGMRSQMRQAYALGICAHQQLDAAVAAAYGWPADLTDEVILERLLALNQTAASRA